MQNHSIKFDHAIMMLRDRAANYGFNNNNMEMKLCTNKFYLNKELYLKKMFVCDGEQFKKFELVVQGYWQEHSDTEI
jgi:hypothetical protein